MIENNREKYSGRKRSSVSYLVHSPNGSNNHGWTRLKSGARNFIEVCYMGAKT